MHVEEELFAKGAELVASGEKNLALSTELANLREKYAAARADVRGARATLLKGIAGEEADVSMYKHVAIEELLRLRLRAAGQDDSNTIPFSGSVRNLGGNNTVVGSASGSSPKPAVLAETEAKGSTGEAGEEEEYGDDDFEAAEAKGGKPASQVEGQLRLEKECEKLRARNRKQAARIAELQGSLVEMSEAVAVSSIGDD